MRELGNDGHLLLSVSFLYATWSGMTVLIEGESGDRRVVLLVLFLVTKCLLMASLALYILLVPQTYRVSHTYRIQGFSNIQDTG